MPSKLVSIEEARARVLAEAAPLPLEARSLTEALGAVLGEDIVAAHSVPPFDNSGMDGFAVRAVDVVDATADSPVTLLVSETIPAGHVATHRLGPGEAAKIMTGAPLPGGADAVVQSESTREEDGRVFVFEAVRPGRNIRRAGEDVARGDRVLAAGSVLGPAEIGVLASLGAPFVQVHQAAASGDHLHGQRIGRGRPASRPRDRSATPTATRCGPSVSNSGIEATALGIVPDDYEATRRLVEQGLEYDVLLTSGGVSVGQFDFVKDVQDELGVERRLWGVAMKPGKPLAFGVRGSTLVFGLPGNPVSAMVSFELFVRPALLRLMGYRKTTRPPYRAIIAEDVANADGRTYVVRVRAWREGSVWHVSSTGAQGSGILRSMVGANGLAFVPGGPRGVRAGEEVEFLLLREDLQEP